MTRFRWTIVALCICASGLALAPQAAADDASFLSALDRSGVTRVSDPKALRLGYGVCTDLRRGVSMDEAYATMGTDLAGLIGSSRTGTKETYFRTAVQELCPEWMPR